MFMNPDQTQEIVDELHFSEDEITLRCAASNFSTEDLLLIKDIQSRLTPEAIRSFGEKTAAWLEKQTLLRGQLPVHIGYDDLHRIFSSHLESLLSGPFDSAFAESRLQTGLAHYHIGLKPKWYVAFYSRYVEELLELVFGLENERHSELGRRVAAVCKSVILDLGLVLEIYFHAEHAKFERMANHDMVTGLPNYYAFLERILQSTKGKQNDGNSCLLMIGLNRFKAINETLGHAVGDRLLKAVADRLSESLEQHAILSKLGGDLFAVYLDSCNNENDIEEIAHRLLRQTEEPIQLENLSIDVASTAGASIMRKKELDPASLLSKAEAALYTAKKLQQPFALYQVDMKRYSVSQLGLGTELKRAIDSNELVLYYQPKVDAKNRSVVGVEALVRWVHPLRGFMPPGDFIPLAEKTEIIHPLTDWVIDMAVRQAAEWKKRGISVSISINLAAPNLQNAALANQLKSTLQKHSIDPAQLVLEITESGMMADPDRALDTIFRLREIGVSLSIDDFGTGYSSLAYLKNLPVDEVKIDQVFVSSMLRNPKDESIVRITIDLAKRLGLSCSAEGIEDEETLERLCSLGCDTVQGYHISRPLPHDELEFWLSTQKTTSDSHFQEHRA